MTELTRRCLSLDRKRRESLVKILQESLEEKEHCCDERFQTLYKIATDMFGQGILTSSRDFPLVLGRRFIAYQMREEGYSYSAIGRHLIRNHASVMHMTRMMEDCIKYQFNLEMAYWEIFQKKIKEYETNKRTNQDS